MWDAWAAFDDDALGYLYNESALVPVGSTVEAARDEAISYAAYRVLKHRYAFSTNSVHDSSCSRSPLEQPRI
jgi:hypothetical protein